jgi:hypothetical protein
MKRAATKWPEVAMIVLGVLFGLASCDGPEDDVARRNVNGPDENDPKTPQCTEQGIAYKGFADTNLNEGRVNAKIGVDRARMKPYAALRGEYERVLGVTPDSLEGAEASFGRPPDRFAQEPRASAIQLFSAYRVGFDGCLTYVDNNKATFSAAPNPDTAATQCKAMARKFWSRAATDDEVKACTEVALTDSASEPDPQRRWAYTCASLLSASGFLTY